MDGSPSERTDNEWRAVLSEESYNVLRRAGTERPWSSAFNDLDDEGLYVCAGCGVPLFTSSAKFDSGSGWPSFWAPATADSVTLSTDFKAILPRTEVRCASCSGHLGHVFNDGPAPTGQRYCMNGVAMSFESGTAAAESAATSFASSSEQLDGPPLLATLSQMALNGALCLGLAWCWLVRSQAASGAGWAIDALSDSDTWLFGLVNGFFGGKPPGGPLTLVLAGLQGFAALQKLPLLLGKKAPLKKQR